MSLRDFVKFSYGFVACSEIVNVCSIPSCGWEHIFFPFSPVTQEMCLEKITNLHLFVQDHQHFSRFGQSQKIILLKISFFLHTSNLA